ncbi:hypothetical protein [Salibacterium qingdaonense]|uniref:Uncharacterized protein n=1 Tax=Salibacterium qingdaonense TaxID=266892 RepID=A0A1I4Q646_9BACI|nr:hypothetical protein [Salibacterium qingdaonense]SFM35286.1 hypothetical protein SAMN04488054_13710 [Salibacterium qingdaonense]
MENEYLTLTLHMEDWEYLLAAAEDMSCGYRRSEPVHHCCDLNEPVSILRTELGYENAADEGADD